MSAGAVKIGATVREERSDDCRCLCGSLLARLTDAGVELKCRRCKRTLLIRVPLAAAGVAQPLEVCAIRGGS